MTARAPEWGKRFVDLIRGSGQSPVWRCSCPPLAPICAAVGCAMAVTERLVVAPGVLSEVGFCFRHAGVVNRCVAALDALDLLDGLRRAGGES